MSITKKILENKEKNNGLSAEDNAYMKSKPTRLEVANYVNSLMEQHYMPLITNYIQMSSMVLQAILLRKGICTGDEIKEITEEFVKENQRRVKETQALKEIRNPDNQAKTEEMENGLVARIDKFLKEFTGETWKAEKLGEDERKSIYYTIYTSIVDLVNVNINSSDEELMKTIEGEIPDLLKELNNLDESLESETISITNVQNKILLTGLVKDLIERLNKGLFIDKDSTEND